MRRDARSCFSICILLALLNAKAMEKRMLRAMAREMKKSGGLDRDVRPGFISA